MATRAAIYARFSTDMQRDRSIDDQVAVCRQYAERQAIEVVEVFADRAASGASLHGRDGILDLVLAAKDGQFDVVIVETMSRIGRDEEDRAAVRKRLTFAGVKIMTPVDGEVNRLTDGIKAVIDSQYLEDLKTMIRRGMAGVTRDGRHAGGRAYGYRPVPGAKGELTIVEEEAAIVARIFDEYVAGRRPRAIAAGLNGDRVPAPRGSYWTASALSGNKARGHGILVNPIYAGEIVWNRVRMVKDPETGRRVSRVNPQSDWQRQAVPKLAIIDAEKFALAQELMAGRGSARGAKRRTPARLLSGLLRCGCCGAGMSIKDTRNGVTRIQCSGAKESGRCSNTQAYPLDVIEQSVTSGLKDRLGSREAIAIYVSEYNAERKRLAGRLVAARSRMTSRLAAVQRELDRAIQGVVKGLLTDAEARSLLADLRQQKKLLEAELATSEEPPKLVELHPTMVNDYLAAIDHLTTALAQRGPAAGQAIAAVRKLVDTVTISRKQVDGGFSIEVEGKLNRLIGGSQYPTFSSGVQGGSGGGI